MADLGDSRLAQGTFRRLLEPAEETEIVEVVVTAREGLASFADGLEADYAAVGRVLLSGRDFVEGALEDSALEIVGGMVGVHCRDAAGCARGVHGVHGLRPREWREKNEEQTRWKMEELKPGL